MKARMFRKTLEHSEAQDLKRLRNQPGDPVAAGIAIVICTARDREVPRSSSPVKVEIKETPVRSSWNVDPDMSIRAEPAGSPLHSSPASGSSSCSDPRCLKLTAMECLRSV
jgi:hypothetical protein